MCTALTGFSVSQGCRPRGGARARDPLSAPVSLLSACRCQVRISPQPFPGTRMYVTCYIPEPTMYGAFTASVVFVLLRENCRRAHSGEQRDSIRCLYDIRASIVALGETIRSFLVKKKERERERVQTEPRNMTNKTHPQNYLNVAGMEGTPQEVTDVSADWISVQGGHRCFCQGRRACFPKAARTPTGSAGARRSQGCLEAASPLP